MNLTLIFERLFAEPMGGGYPKERAIPEQRNARILSDLKKLLTEICWQLSKISTKISSKKRFLALISKSTSLPMRSRQD